MTTKEILEYLLKDIHTSVMATVNEEGHPVTAVIDMMLLKDEKLYFITARGKSFYKRLMASERISLTGFKGEDTLSSVAISLRGCVRDVGNGLIDEVFEKNGYMKEIYPTDESKRALTVFEIYKGEGEYFDLSKKPLERYTFSLSSEQNESSYPYVINDKCTACGGCLRVCPTACILEGSPFSITQKNCLHCGNCFETCQFEAVDKNI